MFENYSEVVVLLVKALQHELTVEEKPGFGLGGKSVKKTRRYMRK